MAWSDIESALRYWVKASTGLDDAHVIWAEQAGTRPEGSFATLKLGPILAMGAYDEIDPVYDSDNDELHLTVRGLREFSVSAQFFTGATTGNANGRALASKAQTGLVLPAIRAEFEDAGFSIFDAGRITNITELVGFKFEGRALLEIRGYAGEEAIEVATFIEEVETENYMGPPLSELGTAEEIDI